MHSMADPRDDLRQWFRDVMARKGWSARRWGEEAKLASSNITRFLSQEDASTPKLITLVKFAEAAGVELPTISHLIVNEGDLAEMKGRYKNREFSDPVEVDFPPSGTMPRDVPVLGVAAASNSGDGAFNIESTIVDYGRRPPALASARDVYGLYIASDSMEPVYRRGDLVYVRPRLPARPGDDVIIYVPRDNGEPPACFIKRLVRRTAERLIVQQFNPEREIEFPLERTEIHRVLTLGEVLGT